MTYGHFDVQTLAIFLPCQIMGQDHLSVGQIAVSSKWCPSLASVDGNE